MRTNRSDEVPAWGKDTSFFATFMIAEMKAARWILASYQRRGHPAITCSTDGDWYYVSVGCGERGRQYRHATALAALAAWRALVGEWTTP
jgi:hypothetical protein